MAPTERELAWMLGTIGFAYADWGGPFYPRILPAHDRLAHYASIFNAVEIDATFHSVPAVHTVRRWADAVPSHFRFCLKAPRLVTHGPYEGIAPASAGIPPGYLLETGTLAIMKRLLDAAAELGPKLGAVLLQFPAVFGPERRSELDRFLGMLPRSTRYAAEFRNAGWWSPATAALLREHGVAWVAADEARKKGVHRPPDAASPNVPRPFVSTGPFMYVRWIGWHKQFPDERREHVNPSARLEWWAARMRAILERSPEITEVFGFFGNGYAGHAPATCRRFRFAMGLPPVGPEPVPDAQGLLFENPD